MVEADAAAEGVAPRRTLGALLSRHLQELPGVAREGWRHRGMGGKKGRILNKSFPETPLHFSAKINTHKLNLHTDEDAAAFSLM